MSAAMATIDGLPGKAELWDWQLTVNSLGQRLTGSPAHLGYIDWLEKQFVQAGLTVERLPHRAALRWSPRAWSLGVDGRDVPTTGYYPYSGVSPHGVTAPLTYGGPLALDLAFGSEARGKIVLLDLAIPQMELAEWYPEVIGLSPALDALPESQHRIGFGVKFIPADLMDRAKTAGLAGLVLGWTGVSDEASAGQYLPFSKRMGEIPALWVGEAAFADLRKAVQRGASATLQVDAEVTHDAPSDTLIATLPGQSAERIILWTHSDGPNAVQDNGGLGILAVARDQAARPLSERPRTLTCIVSDGHFSEAYISSSLWMRERPDLTENAACALCIEHLGTQEWGDLASGAYGPTGRTELGLAFTTDRGIGEAFTEALAAVGRDAGRIAVLGANAMAISPGLIIATSGVPTMAYIPNPQFLMQAAPNGGVERLDATRMHAEVRAFGDLVTRLQNAPTPPRVADRTNLPRFHHG